MTDEPTDDLWLEFLSQPGRLNEMMAMAIDIDGGGKSRDLSIFLSADDLSRRSEWQEMATELCEEKNHRWEVQKLMMAACERARLAEAKLAELEEANRDFLAAVDDQDPRCLRSSLNRLVGLPKLGDVPPPADYAAIVAQVMTGGEA